MKTLLFILILVSLEASVIGQKRLNEKISVIGYYDGDAERISKYPIEKLTHIIFSFCHLKGNKLWVDNKRDTVTIQKLVSLKQRNPQLKVILSLGGWGGCETCSPVFSTEPGRQEFAKSVKEINNYFKTDGLDLDWEYPAIAGFEGHAYTPADKHNFTLLVAALRKQLGPKHEISFAAGGFTQFLEESIEWSEVVKYVDKINLMTYDLVNGNSTVTGHHTPLFSTAGQVESTDNAVRYLDSIGVPKEKLIIGAAIYGRIFTLNEDANNGLYQKGKFTRGISFSKLNKDSLQNKGFTYHWDDVAKAPYMYSPSTKELLTFDDERSIEQKTKYVIDKQLGGIMFWQLADDKPVNGLLDVIDKNLR